MLEKVYDIFLHISILSCGRDIQFDKVCTKEESKLPYKKYLESKASRKIGNHKKLGNHKKENKSYR